ncbi:hypothetical protein [Acetivibrio cellulolyticus]|uniref:hypothetical protein n=1 Tax=Acetivibrio cellulolyticus TaxID=35830 RepID=UPI0001E2F102|nr:hypothetical protein [Acetivibrio cellulolyticus]
MQIANRSIFEKRDRLSLIDQLNIYIGSADSEWIHKIKPIDDRCIVDLKKYLGMEEMNLDFPYSFVEFAKYAGGDDGGLLSKPLKGEFSIMNLIEQNKEIYNFEKESLDPYNFEFLTDEVGMSYILKLDNNTENGVFYEDTCFISSSFENLLFQCAVRSYEEKFFLKNIGFGASINSMRETEELRKEAKPFEIMDGICDKYCLKKSWFNDEFFYFAYSENLSVLLINQVAVAGKIFGNDDKMIKTISEYLLPKLGADVQQF